MPKITLLVKFKMAAVILDLVFDVVLVANEGIFVKSGAHRYIAIRRGRQNFDCGGLDKIWHANTE